MELTQLKDYLKAAVDMEAAIAACEEALEIVDNSLLQKTKFKSVSLKRTPPDPMSHKPIIITPPEPVKPILDLPTPPIKREVKYEPVLPKVAETTSPKLFQFRRHSKEKILQQQYEEELKAYEKRYKKEVEDSERQYLSELKEYNSKKSIIEKEYQQKLQEYEKKMISHREYCERVHLSAKASLEAKEKLWRKQVENTRIENQAILEADRIAHEEDALMRVELKKIREGFCNRIQELKIKLEGHYNIGILYPSFRNWVAVSQIYEYIASGISFRLEGADGAYAQYMNDVRINLVCSSIEQLKQTVIQGLGAISNMQHVIAEEIKENNIRLKSIENGLASMHNELSIRLNDIYSATLDVGSDIQHMTSTISDQLYSLKRVANNMEQGIDSINKGIDNVNISCRTTAMNSAIINFNQYLDMKSRGVDGYYSIYEL